MPKVFLKNFGKSIMFLFIALFCMAINVEAQIVLQPPSTILAKGKTPCLQDFEDFIAFAAAFGSKQDDPNFNFRADFNFTGTIDFSDFIAFTQTFGSNICPSQFITTGRVTLPDTALFDVGLELFTETLHLRDRQKTNANGYYQFSYLKTGKYFAIPKKFGYTFTPDTLLVEISDDDIKLPDIQAQRLFTLVDIKVLQHNEPVSNIDVIFSLNSGQSTPTKWKGITDQGGVATVRITTQNGQFEDRYQAIAIDQATQNILYTWTNIPIQADDTRRLVLLVDSTAYYVPEREYSYFFRDKEYTLTPSDRELRVEFRPDTLPTKIDSLLSSLELEKNKSDYGSEQLFLKNTQGRGAVLEAINILKRSGLVLFALPHFVSYPSMYTSETYIPSKKLIVKFKSSASETDITALNETIGATIEIIDETGAYHLGILDLLSQDIFEVVERYRNHSIVESAIIDAILIFFTP